MKKGLVKAVVLMLTASLALSMLAGCGKKKNHHDDDDEEVVVEQNDDDDEEEFVEIGTEIEKPAKEYSIYEQFLGLDSDVRDVKAVVDDGVYMGYADFEGTFAGNSYTLDELIQAMGDNRLMPGEEPVDLLFSYINVGDEEVLALKFTNMHTDGEGDESYTVAYVADVDGELHITYSVSAWSRNTVDVKDNGVIHTRGSAGAGESISDFGLIGKHGKYNSIYTADEMYGDWIAMNLNGDTYWSVFSEDNQASIYVIEYDFDGVIVYTTDSIESGEMTAADEKYIELSKAEGMDFVTKEEFNTMLDERLDQIGVDREFVNNNHDIAWMTYKDTEDGRVATYYLSPETDTAYWNYSSQLGYQVNYQTELWAFTIMEGTPAATIDEVMEYDIDMDSDMYANDDKMFYLNEAQDPKTSGYFQIYITNNRNTIIVTPDRQMVKNYVSPVDFIYGTTPKIVAADYDNDGVTELGVWEYILHGTGFSQDTFYIVDKNSETGEWGAYLLGPDCYVNMLSEHFMAVDNGDSISIYLDNELVNEVDKKGDDSAFELMGAYMVEISTDGKEALVSVTPMFYSDNNPVGFAAGNFDMYIAYRGDGSWEYISCEYEDAAF